MNQYFKKRKSGIEAVLDQAVVSGTGFLSGILLARWCMQVEYGLYVLAISLLVFWENARVAFVNTPLTIFLPRKADRGCPAYLGGSMVLEILVMAIGMAIAAASSAAVYLLSGDRLLANVLAVTALAVSAHSVRGYLRGVFIAQLQPGKALLIDTVVSVFQFAGIGILFFISHLKAAHIILAAAAAQTIGTALGLFILISNQDMAFRNIDFRDVLQKHWEMGSWMVYRVFSYTGALMTFPWFLKFTHGTQAVAVLGACICVINISGPFWLGYQNLLSAKMAHAYAAGGAQELCQMVQKGQKVMFFITGSFLLFFIIFSSQVLTLLYGMKYQDFGYIVVLLAINTFVMGWTFPLEQGLITVGRADFSFYIYLIVMFITLTIGFSLVKHWGIPGAAYCHNLACACVSGIRYFFYRRVMQRSVQ